MHLVPAEHAHRRIIDNHRVCDAIAGIGEATHVHTWAERFALLADPSRLTLLLAIHAVPNICVSDLAVAAGMNDTTVSQALRLLRAAGLVQAHKDGRTMATSSPTTPPTTCSTTSPRPSDDPQLTNLRNSRTTPDKPDDADLSPEPLADRFRMT